MLTKLEGNNKRWLFNPDLEEKYTEVEIKLKQYGIKNYIINDDGTIDVNDDVKLNLKELLEIPFKFGKISGDFKCNDNYLKSLEGAPTSVGGIFNCSYNDIISLKFAPTHVGGSFRCLYNNKLTSLEGCPKYVGGNFYCYDNKTKFTPEDIKAVCEVKGKIKT